MSHGGEPRSPWERVSASFALLAHGADGRWHPGIGDPTFIGWFTVAAYFAAAYFCFQAMRAAQALARKLEPKSKNQAADERALSRLWGLSTLTMGLLGINKQLDLQSWFTQTLRDMAFDQGWYENRRTYQMLFIVCIGLLGVLVTGGLAYTLRRVLSRAKWTVVGLALICCFVVIRAASFHHVDLLLGLQLGQLRLNALVELTGIATVALGARGGLLGYRSKQQP